ncbi:MAG: hypothetical protein ACP5NV_02490 [Candidatus Woesearchaeota archaeon]
MLSIILIVSLVSSIALATIYVRQVEGSLGIDNFRTVEDTVSFNISSTSDILEINGETANCQKQSFNYYCAITDEINQPLAEYTIENAEGESALTSINIDNSIGNIIYSISNIDGNVTLTYDITDTGYDGSAACAGLLRAEIWWRESNTDIIDFTGDTNCKKTGTRTLAITESGKSEFYIDVYDKLENYKQSEKKNLTIDVSSPQASDLEILNDGIPLEIIAPNTDFLIDLTFDISEENLSSITADISDITNNPALKVPYRNINVPVSSCTINTTENGRVYYCIIQSKILNTNKESVNITLTSKDSSGNTEIATLEKSFSIDDVRPEVEITTEYCDNVEDICYVKNGINKLIFQLTKDNFEKKNIYFEVGETIGRVANCSGSVCHGYAAINCNNQIQARILGAAPYISQDDSGNRIVSYSRTLYCDNSIPKIMNTTWGSNSVLGDDLLVSESTISLIATVNEQDSKISASAYFDKIKNETLEASCEDLSNGQFNCTWSVFPINDGYYDANVIITARDIVNNSDTKTQRVRILGFKSDNETPDLLKLQYSRNVPESLNRITLRLAQFNSIPVYAYTYYSITPKSGQEVKLLMQELSVDNCVLRDKKGNEEDAAYIFSEIKIADNTKDIGENHRIDFTFDPSFENYNMLGDNTKVVCNISAYVQKGDYVYRKPQVLTIEIPFKLRNSQLDAPGEEYVKKIQEVEKSTTSDYSILIANLDSFMVTAQNFCTLKSTLDYAGLAGVGVQLAGMSLSAIPGMQSLQIVGGQIFNTVQNSNTLLYDPKNVESRDPTRQGMSQELPMMGLIGQACMFMSCTLDYNNPLTLDKELADTIEDSAKDLPLGLGDEISEGLTNSEMKNSLVMSAMKLCIPGVVYNLNKYRQVDCEYLECMKVYSASGLDVSQCEAMKASKTCSIIVGEAFELPYVRIGKNLFSNIADTVRMSYGYGLVKVLDMIKESGVCKDSTSDGAIVACNVPYAIQQYLSGQKKTKMSQEFYYQQTRDFCQSSKCVGPKCYPSNQLFGIPLPQFTPTNEQRMQMNLMRQYGGLYGDTHLLVSAHGSSDVALRRSKLNEWNTRVSEYNNKYQTEYPLIDVEKNSVYNNESNQVLSTYFNKFNVDKNLSSDPQKLQTQLLNDPTTRYNTAINEYNEMMRQAESNPLYIGTQKTSTPENIIRNIPINNRKDYSGLRTVLPGASKIPIHENKDVATEKEYYYFENNVLYYYNNGNTQRIIEYNSDGTPKKTYFEEIKDPEKKWLANISTKLDSTEKAYAQYNNISSLHSEKTKKLNDAYEEYRKQKLKEKAVLLVNIFMDQLGFKKFMTADYWEDKWGPGKYITEVADFADPAIWKNNLCNPDNGLFYSGNDQPEGTAYSCDNSPGQGCKLVLTYGAEVLDYGNGTYLYTMTYVIGTVPHNVQFNVLLKGDGTLKGFNDYKLLNAFNRDGKATVILSNKKFTQMCVAFNGDFPDKGDSYNEFCRPIKKDVFKTGKPVIDENIKGYPSGNIGGNNGANGGFFE